MLLKPNKDLVVVRYTLFGVGFGLLFPIVGLLLDCCVFNNFDVSLQSIQGRIIENPIHIIILTAPVFLGVSFYVAGRMASNHKGLNKRLIAVNEQLTLSNDSLDSFNYHVSHDLKTLVNNTLSLTKMATKYNEKKDGEKVREVLIKLNNVAINGRETVESFLELSRAEKFLNEKGDISINVVSVIEDVLDVHNLNSDVAVSFGGKEFKTIKIHPKALESIFLNLFTNSIKYNKNSPEVRIELQIIEDELAIFYSDNGIGMDMSKIESKLFQPFVRFENDLKASGTGVGLSLVKKLITSYSGRIEVESILNKGTTFKLFFPK